MSTTTTNSIAATAAADGGSISFAQHFVIHYKGNSDYETSSPSPRPSPTATPTPQPISSPIASSILPTWPTAAAAAATTPPSSSSTTTAAPKTEEEEGIGSGTIGGHAYFDSNTNGIYDTTPGDINTGGILVYLFSCAGTLIQHGKTSTQGLFQFDNLVAGNYFVILQLPEGYVSSTADVDAGGLVDAIMHDSAVSGLVESPPPSPSNNNNKNSRQHSRAESNICKTVCFAINDGTTSNVELSLGMQVAPPYPTTSDVSSNPPSAKPTTAIPSTIPTHAPSNSRQPSHKPSIYPTRYGQGVGPLRTNGIRMTLFGIERIENETEWSITTARFVKDYFNSEWNYVFDVDVDIVLTNQTTAQSSSTSSSTSFTTENKSVKSSSIFGNRVLHPRQHQKRRRLDSSSSSSSSPSILLEYNQISTYKTVDPSFVDVTYIVQEPFDTTISRFEYISSLQAVSSTYNNVSTVSSVVLPEGEQDRSSLVNAGREQEDAGGTPASNGSDTNGLRNGMIAFFCGILLVLFVFAAFMYRKHKMERPPPAESFSKGSGKRSGDGTGAETVPQPGNGVPDDGFASSLVTAETARSSAFTHSTSSCPEAIIEISIPPGRVGCIVDSSPSTGPYICEIHEFSPLADEIMVGDRILAVDNDDCRRMNAIDVSKILGSRSENRTRTMTILRDYFDGTGSLRSSLPLGLARVRSDDDDDDDSEESESEERSETIISSESDPPADATYCS